MLIRLCLKWEGRSLFVFKHFLLCTLILSVEPVKDKSEDTKSLMQGPPGSGNVLCCEVCGKYGLPQDFSASGRFCSLSCVGCYTGRRNKGREFSKHTKIPNGRIIKTKKKKGRKPGFKKAILHNPVSTQSVEVLRIWFVCSAVAELYRQSWTDDCAHQRARVTLASVELFPRVLAIPYSALSTLTQIEVLLINYC